MKFTCTLKSGAPLNIILPHDVEQRAIEKRFRGKNKKLAGNISHWNSPEEIFEDEFVLRHLLAEMHDIWKNREFGDHSLCIEFPNYIGWSNTDEFGKYQSGDIEHFKPNRKSEAFRVKLDKRDLKAPQTKELTLIWTYKVVDDEPTIIIRSLYPGPDIGELYGPVSARENCVFFDWDHVGA